MSNRRPLAIFTAIVLLLVLLGSLWPDAPGPSALDEAAAAETSLTAPVSAPVTAEPGVERDVVAVHDEAPPAPQPLDLDHPYAFELQLRLVDAFGLPVEGALAFAAPPECGFSLWPKSSDELGRVHLRWRGRLHSMRVHVAVLAWGVLQPMRMVTVQADQQQQLAIVVLTRQPSEAALAQQSRSAEERALDERRVRRARRSQRDELDVLCGRTQFLFQLFTCTNCHDDSRIANYATLARCGDMLVNLHPEATFCDLGATQVDDAQILRRKRLFAGAAEGADAAEERRKPRGSSAVAGTVRGHDGELLADVPVVWLGANGTVQRRTMTNPSGRYRLEQVAAGNIDVRAGGGPHGHAVTTVATLPNDGAEWHARLQRSSVVLGRALDEQGRALHEWLVEFESLDRTWAASSVVRHDGTFSFADVPGMGQCLLRPAGEQGTLPVLTSVLTLPESAPLTLQLEQGAPTRARLRLRPALPPNTPWAQVETRVTQLETGRVTQLKPLGRDDSFEVGGLPAGAYLVEVGAPVLGWAKEHIVDIDGRGLWDLGTVTLPPPGRVRIVAKGKTKSLLGFEHAFCRRTPSVDVQETYRAEPDGSLLLPAGEHVFFWRDRHGLHRHAFTLTSGGFEQIEIDER